MKNLADKSFAFSARFLNDWEDATTHGAIEFQNRYLFKQAWGARAYAQSYWILRETGQHDIGKVVARHLLERMFSARVAKCSPELAVELIVADLKARIRAMRKFVEVNAEAEGIDGVIERIEDFKKEEDQFLAFVGSPATTPDWSYLDRARYVGLEWAYRSMYWDFSRFVHAGYELPHAGEINRPDNHADFIALLSPVDTAIALHGLSCQAEKNQCPDAAEYRDLYGEFMSATSASLDDEA